MAEYITVGIIRQLRGFAATERQYLRHMIDERAEGIGEGRGTRSEGTLQEDRSRDYAYATFRGPLQRIYFRTPIDRAVRNLKAIAPVCLHRGERGGFAINARAKEAHFPGAAAFRERRDGAVVR